MTSLDSLEAGFKERRQRMTMFVLGVTLHCPQLPWII